MVIKHIKELQRLQKLTINFCSFTSAPQQKKKIHPVFLHTADTLKKQNTREHRY